MDSAEWDNRTPKGRIPLSRLGSIEEEFDFCKRQFEGKPNYKEKRTIQKRGGDNLAQ